MFFNDLFGLHFLFWRIRKFAFIHLRQRPYRVECTGSLPNSEVKRRRARIVPGWGTAWEVLRVLLAFLMLWLFRGLAGLFLGFYGGWSRFGASGGTKIAPGDSAGGYAEGC